MTRGDAPLIGVADMATPHWASGHERAANAGLLAIARAAPRTAATAVLWGWRTSPRLTVLTALVHLVSGAVTAFGLLATAGVFAHLLEQGPTPERVLAALPAVAAVVAAGAARGLLVAATGAVDGMLLPQVEQRAQYEIHAAVLAADLVAFEDADFAELVERAGMMGPSRLKAIVRDTSDVLAALVSVAASIITVGVLHPLLVPVVLLAAVPQGWAAVRAARLRFTSIVRTTSQTRRLGVVRRLITGREAATEIRAFTTQEVLLAEHRRIAHELTAEEIRVGRHQTGIQLTGRTLSGLGTALAYLVLALLLYAGELPLALAGAAAVAMRSASGNVTSVVFDTNRLYEGSFYVDLFRTCVDDARTRRRPPATAELRGDPAEIRLDGVTFRYPGQPEPALDGIDATLRRGEVIALVGENGSGKSTLAKLITGLYLPDAGAVTWDGVPTGAVDAQALQERIAMVLQEPLRWPMTAENNVRIGRLEAVDPGDERLVGAAGRSGADAVVTGLAQGWSTVLSREFPSGRDLSGGQWQRISVARGLYRDAPVVIADEPTAALDAHAEHAVFATLRALGGSDRITVLVTHRLANVRHADRILVLERGRLVEWGTHEELMAREGPYRALYDVQASAYARP
ncbi:ABC transporter ATP-binding protein [Pseudonocardia sp. GCM10023141]|uniref:ABC transporter ATP-binding protein n=1 Tax=Pseudonocardia sp. GCM10023141 TaxID=3252653 RepID=UPI00360A38A9